MNPISCSDPAGSSPLTRGAHYPRSWRCFSWGLIPAHAGSTGGLASVSPGRQAHPRSRGEHRRFSPVSSHTLGSSPLTRGAPDPLTAKVEGGRLIPAHAGSTWSISTICMDWGAHPRSRGEHSRRWHLRLSAAGSSPLTRGAPNARLPMCPPPRLIPAHAGSTGRDFPR